MTVKIVTDSIGDLPAGVVKSLDITVIPMELNFGEEVYRDGIDITPEQFYDRLKMSNNLPHTSVPPMYVFSDTFDNLAKENDEILVITVSSKLAACYNGSLQAINIMKKKCHIEVLDSQWAGMAQGFVVMAAAKAAMAGESFENVKQTAKKTMSRVEFHATFDTLEYLGRGGRIGHAWAMLGSLLKVNPVITLKKGIVEPVSKARSRAKAIDQLFHFAEACSRIEEMAVEDAAADDEADALVERLSKLYPKDRIYRTKTAPTVGAHTGPSLLLLAIQGNLHSRA
jgi:DegV family protein with EDD domain